MMDSEYRKVTGTEHEPDLTEIPFTLRNLPSLSALALIRLYQNTFARLIPVEVCRFQPTCSHYGYQAIVKYGMFKGGWMAIRRIMRCNPLNPGGFDPVP
jgi:putative membrane protein insertion efficiency factor